MAHARQATTHRHVYDPPKKPVENEHLTRHSTLLLRWHTKIRPVVWAFRSCHLSQLPSSQLKGTLEHTFTLSKTNAAPLTEYIASQHGAYLGHASHASDQEHLLDLGWGHPCIICNRQRCQPSFSTAVLIAVHYHTSNVCLGR
jgi:hypothetical protein